MCVFGREAVAGLVLYFSPILRYIIRRKMSDWLAKGCLQKEISWCPCWEAFRNIGSCPCGSVLSTMTSSCFLGFQAALSASHTWVDMAPSACKSDALLVNYSPSSLIRTAAIFYCFLKSASYDCIWKVWCGNWPWELLKHYLFPGGRRACGCTPATAGSPRVGACAVSSGVSLSWKDSSRSESPTATYKDTGEWDWLPVFHFCILDLLVVIIMVLICKLLSSCFL